MKDGKQGLINLKLWKLKRQCFDLFKMLIPCIDLRLNLGSGRTRFIGFINVDYSKGQKDIPKRYIDVDFDFCNDKFTQFKSLSVVEIRCYHLLEHLPYPVAYKLLYDCFRMLKNHGLLKIVVPNPENENIRQLLPNYNLKTNNMHCSSWKKEDLKQLIFDIGFHFVYERPLKNKSERDFYSYMMVADKRLKYIEG